MIDQSQLTPEPEFTGINSAMPNSPNRTAEVLLNEFFTDPANSSTALDLSSCGLIQLPQLFETLIGRYPQASARLVLLNLAHNKLTDLPPCLSKLPNLRILFLLRNEFFAVPAVIRMLKSVRMLSFKENKIEGELKSETLPPNLTWLILTSNRLTGLDGKFPMHCRHVRKLMLSNNLLNRLPAEMRTEMMELELIRLANNRFEEIPRHVLEIPCLAWVAFSGNPCTMSKQLPTSLQISDLNAKYEIDWDKDPLGSGASGKTYAGKDWESGLDVVVKRFHAMAGSDGRAEDEVDLSCAAAGVPNLVHALGYGTIDNVLYLVTKRVDGDPVALAGPPSFDSCVRSIYGKGLGMSRVDKLRVIECIESAVKGLLDRGICHGDVYAHNVLVSYGEQGAQATLADLGAAWKYPAQLKNEVTAIELRALSILKDEILNLDEP